MSRIALILFLLQLVVALTVNADPTLAVQHIVIVPDEQPTIQAAINAAFVGDTVYVKAGVYYENVIVNKSIILIGEDKETTIIDGLWRDTVVNITASHVTLSGFTIRNSGAYPSCGICLKDSQDSVISHNILTNITELHAVSVFIYNSDNCSFTHNFVVNNGRGVLVKQSNNVSLTYNHMISNGLYGVRVDNCTGCRLTRNIIESTYGESNVRLVSANSTCFFENIVSNSTYAFRLISSHHNIFYRNNFINKAPQTSISDSYNNIWYNASLMEGNYWSDYEGQDLNSDGIGDTPYIIDVYNADEFPLMKPWMPLIGDLNIDGKVTLQDLTILAKAYGSTNVDSNWNPLADVAPPYGKVSLTDLVTVASNYGKTS